ncbi:MAG: hypothetical protein A2V99_08425 [Spirochaetes bacterium RBG_16_67_19]|nr:MAG: hypothetical protein A2V99_08425 [Spirochaetes bacterium RBG_16_67_19]
MEEVLGVKADCWVNLHFQRTSPGPLFILVDVASFLGRVGLEKRRFGACQTRFLGKAHGSGQELFRPFQRFIGMGLEHDDVPPPW